MVHRMTLSGAKLWRYVEKTKIVRGKTTTGRDPFEIADERWSEDVLIQTQWSLATEMYTHLVDTPGQFMREKMRA